MIDMNCVTTEENKMDFITAKNELERKFQQLKQTKEYCWARRYKQCIAKVYKQEIRVLKKVIKGYVKQGIHEIQ